MAAETVTANGLDLNPASRWCFVEDMAPVSVTAGRRGENTTVPGRHGVIRSPRKRWDQADFVLPVWVLGVDRTTGQIPADPVGQLSDNVDLLLKTFTTETVQVVHARTGGDDRQATCELAMDPVVVGRERSRPPATRISFALTVFGAFWEDAAPVSQTVTTGAAQTLTAFQGATAPMQDLTLTFTGPVNNPMVTHGTRYFKYNGVVSAGRQLVVPTASWTPSTGTGSAWTPDVRQYEFGPGPALFELDPTLSPFEVQFSQTSVGSASMTIQGRRRYLAP